MKKAKESKKNKSLVRPISLNIPDIDNNFNIKYKYDMLSYCANYSTVNFDKDPITLYYYKKEDKNFVFKIFSYKSAANKNLQLFEKQELQELRLAARRHGMTSSILANISKALLNEAVDQQVKLILAQTLKYSVKKGNNFSCHTISALINILKENINPAVHSEIVWSLGYVIKNNSAAIVTQDILKEIKKNLIELNSDAKSFLMQQIEKQQNNDNEIVNFSYGKVKVPINYLCKPPQAAVTKTQQAITVNYKSSQIEETKINTISLIEALKSRNKKFQKNSNAENLPTIEVDDKTGNDRRCYETTYKTVKKLYSLAEAKDSKLKTGDKDEYLIDKFIGWGPKYFGNAIKNFITDRMIAAIFLAISKKQTLTNRAIKKLLICLDKLEVVKSRIFDDKSDKQIACYIFGSSLPNKNLNDLETIIVDKICKIKETYKTYHNNETEIIKEFSFEINQIRLNCIAAIYNSVLLSRGKILNTELLEKMCKCLEDNDKSFKNLALKTLQYADHIDSKLIDHSSVFTGYLEQLENNFEAEEAIQYIDGQAKDKLRCAELFNENTLLRISNIIINVDFDDNVKVLCCNTINNYLEHNDTLGLSEIVLKNYVQILEDTSVATELKSEVLRSILITIEKSKNLPDFVVQTLIRNIENIDQKSANFTIMVLGNICGETLIPDLGKIAHKLLDNSIIVRDGTEITFEYPNTNKENVCETSICSVVGKIFLSSVQQGARLDEECLERLTSCLDGKDRQARILAAKTLYFASLRQEINSDLLFKFRNYVSDKVPDVRTYVIAAYAQGLYNISEGEVKILKSHIEFLPEIYAFEELVLGDENFTDRVNENILLVLSKVASKGQQFECSVFNILEYTLFYGSKGQDDIINILEVYIQNKYHVPENTILAIENAYGVPHLSNKALNVLKLVIINGQSVSDKILKVFTDDFYLIDDPSIPTESFKLLDIANQNQDISDEIFDILEMERAGQIIDKLKDHLNDKQRKGEFKYLKDSVCNGKKLSVNNFKVLNQVIVESKQTLYKKLVSLTYEIRDEESIFLSAVSILMHAAEHKQIIPDYLVDTLTSQFNVRKDQTLLLRVFSSLVKNNQRVPRNLFEKLENTLEKDSEIYDQVLSIFVFQGQKGEKLSHNIITKIFNKFLYHLQDINLQHEYLSSIISIIENNEGFDKKLASQILIKGVLSDNLHLAQNAVNGIKIFANKEPLDDNILKYLVNKVIDCDNDLKHNILSILESARLQQDEKNKLILVKLCSLSGSEALDKMYDLVNNATELLKQNFIHINAIIGKLPELQNKAIKVLLLTPNKKDIIDELLDNISVLSINTYSKEFKHSYHLFIKEIVQGKKVLSPKIISALYKLMIDSNKEEVISFQETFTLIAKNQEIHAHIRLVIEIDTLLSESNPQKLKQLLEFIKKELQTGIKLPSQIVDKLIIASRNSMKDPDLIESFAEVFSSLIIQGQLPNEIILPIEKAILTKKVNKNIIDGYKCLIKFNHYKDLTATLNTLIGLMEASNPYLTKIAILECINEAARVINPFPKKAILVLEDNLENLCSNIKNLSFQGLRILNRAGYKSDVFIKWCKDHLDNLIQSGLPLELNLDEKNLDLLDTLSSVHYLDLINLDKDVQYQQEWHRNLLISDLLERIDTLSPAERFQFYKCWLEIESLPEYQDGRAVIILKLISYAQNNYKYSFNQTFEAFDAIKQVSFKNAYNILSETGNNWQLKLKQLLLKNIISEKSKTLQTSTEYISGAVACLTSESLSIIITCLNNVKAIDNLMVLDRFIEFFCQHEVKELYIPEDVSTIQDLQILLEIKVLSSGFYKQAKPLLSEITLKSLLNKKWDFEQLNLLISKLGAPKSITQDKLQNLNQVLEIIDQYNVPLSAHSRLLSILNKEVCHWVKEVNLIAVETNFQVVGQIKSLLELIRELGDENTNNLEISKLMEDNLKDKIKQVKDPGFESKLIKKSDIIKSLEKTLTISEWNKDHIELWANKVKSDSNCLEDPHFVTEVLAVIKHANLIITGFHLTDAQILSCFAALHAKHNQGRLLQVATGEGKSTIVSVLAIFHALKGKKVNIITSSSVLAERDAKEKARLYKMFGLSTCSNSDKSIYIKGAKSCYKKDIVYGDAAQFQFDTLRDEYSCLDTLSTRKCEVVIVDEVDCMLIDDSSKIARLASTMAGSDQLQPIYHFLWLRLTSLQDRLININGKEYLLYGKVKYNQDKIVLEHAGFKQIKNPISNLKKYIESGNSLNGIGEEIKGDSNVFLDQYLQCYLTALTSEEDISSENIIRFGIKPEGKIKIPSNFKELVKTQIRKWVGSAIEAFNYQERVHYVVHEGKILPVDYNSTGIVQSNTNWGDGLHQFLQIKHNLRMTSETFTTNFLSNIGYFKRYQNYLFGLTGTLGSVKAREVLSNVYDVDLVNIPRLHQKQYIQLRDIIALNHEQWLTEITSSAIREVSKGRGTLIVCNTIEHARIISQNLKKKYRAEAIKLYDMNNMNQEKGIEKVNTGDIIVATNLAGRGTDIKTDDIEKNGGLHVIITFMPPNQRVEEQAFGRTSRQGKRGTGQMILNKQNIAYSSKEARDRDETESLEKFTKSEIKIIETKDKLFNQFCTLLNDVRAKIRKEKSPTTKIWENIKDQFVKVMPSVYEVNMLSAIEEQWGIFLRKIDDGTIKIEQADSEYKNFADQVTSDYKSGTIIKNPYYHIAIANDLMLNNSSQYKEANHHFKKAIKLDENFSSAAFVGKARYILQCKKSCFTKHVDNYKHKTIDNFNKALQILGNEMGTLNLIQTLLLHQTGDIQSELYKQLIQKATLLGSYINSIEKAVSVIKKSQRLIDIKGIKENQSVSYFELERDKNSYMIPKLSDLADYDHFEVTFNDLTVRNDNGTIDQAVDNISIAFKDYKTSSHNIVKKAVKKFTQSTINEKYNDVHITTKHRNPEELRTLLNPDIELAEATKEVAINHLKGKSSFFEWILSKQFWVQLTIIGEDKQRDIMNAMPIAQAKNIIQKKGDKYRFSLSFVIAGETSGVEVIEEVTKDIAAKHLEKSFTFFQRHLLTPTWSIVNLTITTEDKTNPEVEENISVKEAIAIIKKKSDKCRFRLSFLNANKTADFIRNSNISFDVEFLELSAEAAQERIEKTEFESVTLEIQGSPEELLKAVESSNKHVQFLSTNERCLISNKLDPKTALKSLRKGKVKFIKLENLTKEEAHDVVKLCPESKFNINLISVNQTSAIIALKSFEGEENVNAIFKNLGQIQASNFIPKIREANLDFSLTFKNLKYSQAKQLIQKASIEQEEIEITKVKTLSDLFSEEHRPVLELQEFATRGIESLIEINERGFIPWRCIATVSALAAIQMGVGGILIASGFGATIGIGFIAESAADTLTAYRAYSTRQFSWKAYAAQKVVSLTISAISMGWGAIKNAGKGAVVLAEGVGTEVVEQAATQVITNYKTVEKTIMLTGKNLKNLVVKQIGVCLGEIAFREVLTSGSNSMSYLALEQLKPHISIYVQEKVKKRFCEQSLKMVYKMYALENLVKNSNLRQKIETWVADIFNPKINIVSFETWDFISKSLCMLLFSKYLKVNGALGTSVISTFNGIAQLMTIIDQVYDYLMKKLSQLDEESFSIPHLIHKDCKVGMPEAREICMLLEKQLVIGTDGHLNPLAFNSIPTFKEMMMHNPDSSRFISKETFKYQDQTRKVIQIDKIELEHYNHHKDNVIVFIKSLYQKISSFEPSDFSITIKSISDKITDQILLETETRLISPWCSYGMGALTSAVSKSIQSTIIKSQLNSKIKSAKENLEGLERKENQTSEELKKIEELKANIAEYRHLNDKNNTVATLIDHEAKKYIVAYEVREYAQKVKDGKPADLAELYTMAVEHCINIKIVDDIDYHVTEDDKSKDKKVLVCIKKEGNSDSYQMIDSNGQTLSQFDDGYTIFASLTGKSVEQLRNETARAIENNSENFSNSIKAQKWVQKYNPVELQQLMQKYHINKAQKVTRSYPQGTSFFEALNVLLEEINKASGEVTKIVKEKFLKLLEHPNCWRLIWTVDWKVLHKILTVFGFKQEIFGEGKILDNKALELLETAFKDDKNLDIVQVIILEYMKPPTNWTNFIFKTLELLSNEHIKQYLSDKGSAIRDFVKELSQTQGYFIQYNINPKILHHLPRILTKIPEINDTYASMQKDSLFVWVEKAFDMLVKDSELRQFIVENPTFVPDLAKGIIANIPFVQKITAKFNFDSKILDTLGTILVKPEIVVNIVNNLNKGDFIKLTETLLSTLNDPEFKAFHKVVKVQAEDGLYNNLVKGIIEQNEEIVISQNGDISTSYKYQLKNYGITIKDLPQIANIFPALLYESHILLRAFNQFKGNDYIGVFEELISLINLEIKKYFEENRNLFVNFLFNVLIKDNIIKGYDLKGHLYDIVAYLYDIVLYLLNNPNKLIEIVGSYKNGNYPEVGKQFLELLRDDPNIQKYFSEKIETFNSILENLFIQIKLLKPLNLSGDLVHIVPALLLHLNDLIAIIDLSNLGRYDDVGTIFLNLIQEDLEIKRYFEKNITKFKEITCKLTGIERYGIGDEVAEALNNLLLNKKNKKPLKKLLDFYQKGEWLNLSKSAFKFIEKNDDLKQYLQINEDNFAIIIKVVVDKAPVLKHYISGLDVGELVDKNFIHHVLKDPKGIRELIESYEKGKVALIKNVLARLYNDSGFRNGLYNAATNWLFSAGNSTQQKLVNILVAQLSKLAQNLPQRIKVFNFVQGELQNIASLNEQDQSKLNELVTRKILFDGIAIRRAQLDNLEFNGISFVNSTISNVSFKNTVFKNASFIGARLYNVNFDSAEIDASTLSSMVDTLRKNGVSLVRTKIIGDISGIDLSGINLKGADLIKVTSLKNVNLDRTNLREAKLPVVTDLLIDTYKLDKAEFSKGIVSEKIIARQKIRVVEEIIDRIAEKMPQKQKTQLIKAIKELNQDISIIGTYIRETLEVTPNDIITKKFPIKMEELKHVSDYKGKTSSILTIIYENRNNPEALPVAITANLMADYITAKVFGKGNNRGKDGYMIKQMMQQVVNKFAQENLGTEPNSLLKNSNFEQLLNDIADELISRSKYTTAGIIQQGVTISFTEGGIYLPAKIFNEVLINKFKVKMIEKLGKNKLVRS